MNRMILNDLKYLQIITLFENVYPDNVAVSRIIADIFATDK